MNYNDEINTLTDLYNRLLPALKTKKNEMHKLKYLYVSEKDIWNYIKDNKWCNMHNLTLFDMVSDILNTSNDEIGAYVARMVSDIREDSSIDD